MEMALPEQGRALSAAQASSQALAFRDVMKTCETPAWRRLDERHQQIFLGERERSRTQKLHVTRALVSHPLLQRLCH
jgi:hypothetical protein